QAFRKIQHLPLASFGKISKGELIQRCTGDIDTLKKFLQNQLITLLRLGGLIFFAFTMMCLIHWPYALISTALTPVLALVGYWFFQKEGKIWEIHEAEADKVNTMVQENLNNIRLVSAFAREEYEKKRFDQQNQSKKAIGFRHERLHSIYWPSTDLLVFIQVTISIFVGGYLVMKGQITLGEFISFNAYANMVAWPMRQSGQVISEMGMARVALQRFSEIMNSPEEKDPGQRMTSHLQGLIEFRNVTFKYPYTEGAPTLQDVSFRVKAGQKLAIIGPTGAGKSTIAKLLLGFYPIDKGEILLDGYPLESYSKKFLREKIGIALQKAFLFSRSIEDNMRYAQPQASSEKVESVARIAQAYKMKHIFPEGFSTLVGEKGVTLSGGQKQRVALARTILTEPDILIMDDITSALDTETESALLKALEAPSENKTQIMISHRFTSVKDADQIIVLEKGKVIQQGSPEDLLKVEGYFRDIHQVQTSVEQEIEKDVSSILK
ncbi:MAG: ABC transporter ATP-binding protein, partial [Bacteroidota bacterium]